MKWIAAENKERKNVEIGIRSMSEKDLIDETCTNGRTWQFVIRRCLMTF